MFMLVCFLIFDYFVIVVCIFNEGVCYVVDVFGIELVGGGCYLLMWIYNVLFGVWGGFYFEVIVIDFDVFVLDDGVKLLCVWLFGFDDLVF